MRGLGVLRWLLSAVSLLVILVCAFGADGGAKDFHELNDQINPLNHSGDPTIPVSSGMLAPLLPNIPNLEFGFLYSFGRNVSTGRFTADYVWPVELAGNSVLFGEAHAERLNYWSRASVSPSDGPVFTSIKSSTSNRTSLSLGGGYRTMVGENTLIGVNGFYDASRLGGNSPYDTSSLFRSWDSSGGFGLEIAANVQRFRGRCL